MGKNNKQKPVKQFQRYGIRKFTQGVASVMIASGLFFLAGGTASANEVAAQTEPTTSKVAEETTPKKSDEKQEPKQEVKQEPKQEAKQEEKVAP